MKGKTANKGGKGIKANQEAKIEEMQDSAPPAALPRAEKPGLLKSFAVLLLIVIAALSFYYFFYIYPSSSASVPDYAKGVLADKQEFLNNLQSSSKVYLVMDLRGASELQAGRIMQCGTDFAGSSGLVGKDIISYALEDQSCTSIDGRMKLSDCVNNAMGGVGIYIRSSGTTAFFTDKFIVAIGNNYTAGGCRINVVVPGANSNSSSAIAVPVNNTAVPL